MPDTGHWDEDRWEPVSHAAMFLLGLEGLVGLETGMFSSFFTLSWRVVFLSSLSLLCSHALVYTLALPALHQC